jgi:hypothetical protein
MGQISYQKLFAIQFEIAKAFELREGATIQVLDKVAVPELKSKLKKELTAFITTLTSGFVLLLFFLVRQALRHAEQDSESAQKLHGIQPLGVKPRAGLDGPSPKCIQRLITFPSAPVRWLCQSPYGLFSNLKRSFS